MEGHLTLVHVVINCRFYWSLSGNNLLKDECILGESGQRN